MCCVPESDAVAVEPQARLDAVAVEPRMGPDGEWLLLSSSGIGNAIPITLLSQAVCSLVNGVAMSSEAMKQKHDAYFLPSGANLHCDWLGHTRVSFVPAQFQSLELTRMCSLLSSAHALFAPETAPNLRVIK